MIDVPLPVFLDYCSAVRAARGCSSQSSRALERLRRATATLTLSSRDGRLRGRPERIASAGGVD